MNKVYEVCCMEPEKQPGMTHDRDYSLESNRPRVKMNPEGRNDGGSIDVAETGLIQRQPL